MRNPIGFLILSGGLYFPAMAVADPPSPSADAALKVEQDALRNALHPACIAGGGEILVCGRRQSDRDRLPLSEPSSQPAPGEPASAVTAMKVVGLPHFEPVRLRARGNSRLPPLDKPPMFDVGAMVFSIVVRFIHRDREPPPIPAQSHTTPFARKKASILAQPSFASASL